MKIFRPFLVLALGLMLSACPVTESIVRLHDPLEAQEHTRLGTIYEKAGSLDQAEEQYLLAIRKDRGQALAWAGLGNIQMAKKRPAKAMRIYRRALNLKPESPDILNNLAEAALAAGKIDSAQEAVGKAILLGGPNLHYYLDTRGQVRLAMQDYPGACADFCRALEIAPAEDEAFRKESALHLEQAGESCSEDGQ
jgi:tetratricopeptide (TPR) repeat protein